MGSDELISNLDEIGGCRGMSREKQNNTPTNTPTQNQFTNSELKQIEEMAKVLCKDCERADPPCDLAKSGRMCDSVGEQAEALYNAGYRKIPTTDWLTKGISEEQIKKEKQEAFEEIAEQLGYRKQEWISVDERLPERNGRYLTRCNIEGQSLVCILYYSKVGGFNEGTITHWMPLPEAPKMKGGAE